MFIVNVHNSQAVIISVHGGADECIKKMRHVQTTEYYLSL